MLSVFLLLSGTPMRDTVDEFANVMNLILPQDQQLPKGEEFKKLFMKKPDEFRRRIAGYVSYLKSELVVEPKFISKALNFTNVQFKHFKLYPSYLSEFASKYYNQMYIEENQGQFKIDLQGNKIVYREANTIYPRSAQLANFVYPRPTDGQTTRELTHPSIFAERRKDDLKAPLLHSHCRLLL